MLPRRAFFVVIAVVTVSIFLYLRAQDRVVQVVEEESLRLGHGQPPLFAVQVFHIDSIEEDSNVQHYSDEVLEAGRGSVGLGEGGGGGRVEEHLSVVHNFNESVRSLLSSRPLDRDSEDTMVESTHHSIPRTTAPSEVHVPYISAERNESWQVFEPVGATKDEQPRPEWTLNVIHHQRKLTGSSSVKLKPQREVNRHRLTRENSVRLGYRKKYTMQKKLKPTRQEGDLNTYGGYELFYGNQPCTVKNVVYHLPTRPRDTHELSLVNHNLHKCLKAAELTDYFEMMNYTSTSSRNAAHFLMQLREVIPVEYSATHANNSCWKSDLDLKLCKGGVIEGHVNGHPVTFPENRLKPSLKDTLQFHKHSVNSSVLCLPSIFVPGFPKCGSSFMYCLIRRLFRYKNEMLLEKQMAKEPNFWVPEGPVFHNHWPHNLGDISRYMLNFIPRNNGTAFSLPVDASPNTIFQWPRYSESEGLQNYCLVPSVLPIILPHIKYVVVLRDPATMLYSFYWFSNSMLCPSLPRSSQLLAPDDFHYKVVRKILAYKSCRKLKPVDACPFTIMPGIEGLIKYRNKGCGRVHLETAFYYYYIRRWLAVLPREQFLFVKTEELEDDLFGVTESLNNFLELGLYVTKEFTSDAEKNKCKHDQLKFNYRKDPLLQMRNDTRDLLYKFFNPFNQKLAELLQDSKFHWKHP